MKRVAKHIALFIASTTYVWLLFLSATSVATYFTFKDSTVTKEWLVKSGLYENIVEEVSKLAIIQQQQENSLVQITSEDIRDAAVQVFTPESLRIDAENVVDGFYGWFQGKTSGPEFTVDFSARQAAFATVMRAKLELKINELPECATAGRFTVQAFDPFKADCRPKGVDLTEELNSFEKEIAESKDILPEVTYSGDDIKITNNSGELVQIETALPWVPRAYKMLLWVSWLISFLAILAGLTMIFLSSTRRKGFRRFAGGLFFTGAILLFSGIFLRPAFERLNSWSTKTLGSQASFTQNVIDPMFEQINITYARYCIIFGIGYLVPSIAVYTILIFTRKKKGEADVPVETPAPESKPAPEVTKTTAPSPQPIPQPAVQPVPSSRPVASQAPIPKPALQPTAQTASPIASNPTPRPVDAMRPRQPVANARPYQRRPPIIQG